MVGGNLLDMAARAHVSDSWGFNREEKRVWWVPTVAVARCRKCVPNRETG